MTDDDSLIGQRIGVYELQALIGAGGMGRVYRARDTRLQRDVAVKVLPTSLAGDPERLARFEREARLLASLNHPNIAAIYGVEDRPPALVLELVSGETLANRIASGPLVMRDALDIAKQIVAALDAAHEKGIVHRDLKPANIALSPDGTVKVLDFGIAKALRADAHAATTMPGNDTRDGTVLGTAAYMSPEQARGLPVDKRTDIWAFGCVVFEILTGRSAFAGPTSSDTIAAILERDPSWSTLPARVPPRLRRLIEHCLAKDPRQRLRDIGDAVAELTDGADDVRPSTRPGRRFNYAWITSAAVIAFAAWMIGARTRPVVAVPAFESRFALSGFQTESPHVEFSPDGTSLVIAPRFDRPQRLLLRRLDLIEMRELPGTDGAMFPFWSPSGRSVAFFADRKLKRIDLDAEAVQEIADAPIGRGGAWTADDTILFAPSAAGPLFRVPARGGDAVQLTTLEKGQNDHRAPVVLPGGRHFLYYSRGQDTVRGVWVARIDGSEPRRLLDAQAAAVYAPSGHLLFVRQGQLLAQRFDPVSLTLSGEPIVVAANVAINRGVSLATLAVSPSGTIAYATASSVRMQFAWFDRSGSQVGTLGPAETTPVTNPALSPDGRTLAFSRLIDGDWDLWMMDTSRGLMTRLTLERNLDFVPVWMPDNARVIYQSIRTAAGGDIYRRTPGDNASELLLKTDAAKVPTDVSPNGRFLLFGSGSSTTNSDIWVMPLDGSGQPRPLVETRFAEGGAQFSPDMKWFVYASNETDQFEIYVRPFGREGAAQRVSNAGGNFPRWGHRNEIFYVAADGRLMRVAMAGVDRLTFAQPEPLFTTPVDPAGFSTRSPYVVSLDDQRFLMPIAVDQPTPSSVVVLSNWRRQP
jgi:eukaryotic-like serine/threonine-protein kinase